LSRFDVLLVQFLAVTSTVAAGIVRLGARIFAWHRPLDANVFERSWLNLATIFSLFLIWTFAIWTVGVFGVDAGQLHLAGRS